ETARLATRHLAPRPGTDYAILAFLIRELLRDGANADVLARQSTGRDELAAAVETFDAGHAAAVAGVTTDELDELLAAVRRAGPVAIHTGTGITMGAQRGNVGAW